MAVCARSSSRCRRSSRTTAGVPVAFFAVVSIAVIGLYIAYVIPVYLRLRAGDGFQPGPWTLGPQVQVDEHRRGGLGRRLRRSSSRLPVSPAGVPWRDEFDWRRSTTRRSWSAALILIVGLWWVVGAKNTFKGPVRTIDETRARLAPRRRAAARPAARTTREPDC